MKVINYFDSAELSLQQVVEKILLECFEKEYKKYVN